MSKSSREIKRVEVRAPMSGVFYSRPNPDSAPYVELGDPVKKKQVLGLLETMKVFQKLKASANGKIVEILVDNESTVKDNEVVFVIETG